MSYILVSGLTKISNQLIKATTYFVVKIKKNKLDFNAIKRHIFCRTIKEEKSMLTLTDGAKELLDEHFANKTEIPLIRVYLAAG